jgi:para-nitrobenzyl esterase
MGCETRRDHHHAHDKENDFMKASLVPQMAAVLIGVTSAAALCAQAPPPPTEVGAAQLVLLTVPAKGGAKLKVATPAFTQMGDIPFENTQYKGNVFPGLSWTAGPRATKSYIIVMQDADALRNGAPILHWTMLNIPATVTKLDAGMSAPPAGAEYGPNIRGANQAYMGPRTPAGPKHRYHLQLFALDTQLAAGTITTFDLLTAAMKDHVLASGEVIGLGQFMAP